MNRLYRITTLCAIGLLACSLALAQTAITYQGQLKQSGTPFTGTANLEFALFDQPGGGGQIGPTLVRNNWPVSDGLFQAELDFGAVFDGSPRFLQVQVNGTPLIPRQAVRPAPLALHALSANVPPFTGWLISGNDNINSESHFLGTTTNQPLVLRTGNRPSLELSPVFSSGNQITTNIVAGSHVNQIVGSRRGVSIAGGGAPEDHFGSPESGLGGSGPNVAEAHYVTISGGLANRSNGDGSSIGGGGNNVINSGDASTIAGGRQNWINSFYGSIGGGRGNRIAGESSTIGGGLSNSVLNWYATVPGGLSNCAGGTYSFAAGRRAVVRPAFDPDWGSNDPCSNLPDYSQVTGGDQGTFIWADSTDADFISTGPDQFLIRAGGGVGIGTNNPAAALHVAGQQGILIEHSAPQISWFRPGVDTNFERNRMFVAANGSLVTHVAGSARMAITQTGNVGIGVVAPTFQLQLSANSAAKPNSNTWTISSDERLKKDVEPIDSALDRLLALNGVTFQWRDPASQGGNEDRMMGLIAQDVEKVFPEWVGVDAAGYRTLTVGGFEGLVAEALRELTDSKDREIAELRRQLEEQRQELDARMLALEQLLDVSGLAQTSQD